jgi:hypothetical protein
MQLGDYRTTFTPLLIGIVIAIVLALVLKETGSAARRNEIRQETR